MAKETEIDARLAGLDLRGTNDLVATLVSSHYLVTASLEAAKRQLTDLIDVVVDKMRVGGRLIYVGAGTAGLIAEMDAVAIPMTFGIEEHRVVAVVAGADLPPGLARTGTEDDRELGATALGKIDPLPGDVVIGVSASGATNFVNGALQLAHDSGCTTAALVSTVGSPLADICDLVVEIPVGPEVIAGSTRLKAGSAQKLALNTISTASMVRLGRTYGNLMAGARADNSKVRDRRVEICMLVSECSAEEAGQALDRAGGVVEVAIVTLLAGVDPETARSRLAESGGSIRRAAEAP